MIRKNVQTSAANHGINHGILISFTKLGKRRDFCNKHLPIYI
jgi:hypothetical protein